MKKIAHILLFVLIFACNGLFAQVHKQALTGVWQINSAQIADAWLNNYRFFKDKSFIYSFSQYEDSKRIVSIKGAYRIAGDSLILIIKSRLEIVGGDIIQGSQGFQQNELVLDGGKLVEVKQRDQSPIVLVVKHSTRKGVKCITLQNNTYYLVSVDPHKDE